ncbi:Chitinase domain-containing protein 1 [Phlyctochytrium bullatum]|nr:Chitinase domain-containing protein 1 [Phlyctochytrium bullatum]
MRWLFLTLLALAATPAFATDFPDDTPSDDHPIQHGGDAHQQIFLGSASPDDMTVFDRDLVVLNPKPQSIVREHTKYAKSNAHVKETKENVLAYVTPWNNHGYDVAKMFRGKFTHIAPVWYTVKPESHTKYVLHGSHDVDKAWIKEVTNSTGEITPKLVPRFQFTGFERDHVILLANGDEEVIKTLVDIVITECKEQGFDGFVLEFHILGYTPKLVEMLSAAAKADKLQFFVVIPPLRDDVTRQSPIFDNHHFERYKDLVDGFSLMTYDFSSVQTPGPNAPVQWIEENVMMLCPDYEDRPKILLGLNMYGNDFVMEGDKGVDVEPITGTKYLELLKKYKPRITYIEEVNEAVIHYTEEGTGKSREVWYPTLKSIDDRLLAIEELGVGISIWEIGQGLDYFYDLF